MSLALVLCAGLAFAPHALAIGLARPARPLRVPASRLAMRAGVMTACELDDQFDPTDGELVFGPDDDFAPSAEDLASELDPNDSFCSDEVLISSPGVPTLRISRPSNDAVLEQLLAQFQREAMADPKRFDQIMQTSMEQAVRQRPRTWYWSLVWPSAVAMCQWLGTENGSQLLSGQSVLDLGSGVGVAGIGAAALAGASSVVLAEADARALDYAAHNAARNGVSQRVACEQLDWTQPWPDKLRASCSVLLLSDVLYEGDAPEPIARCAAAALQPNGIIVLADQTDRPYDSAARCATLCASLDAACRTSTERWRVESSTQLSVEWADAQHDVQIAVLSRGGSS
jgi:predicted nicotinamide N-methyase